jgi:hypothetical protein
MLPSTNFCFLYFLPPIDIFYGSPHRQVSVISISNSEVIILLSTPIEREQPDICINWAVLVEVVVPTCLATIVIVCGRGRGCGWRVVLRWMGLLGSDHIIIDVIDG